MTAPNFFFIQPAATWLDISPPDTGSEERAQPSSEPRRTDTPSATPAESSLLQVPCPGRSHATSQSRTSSTIQREALSPGTVPFQLNRLLSLSFVCFFFCSSSLPFFFSSFFFFLLFSTDAFGVSATTWLRSVFVHFNVCLVVWGGGVHWCGYTLVNFHCLILLKIR